MPIDYKNYPPNWKSEIVPQVLKRAGNCCETCSLKNGQTVFSIKFKMQDPNDGRYKYKSVWFSSENDAKRELMIYDVKPVKVVLTVAHLDHDELNHDVIIDRLKALCQICHLRYDAKEKYNRRNKK